MKLRNLFACVVASAMALVACQPEEADLGTPSIALSASEVTLSAEGGDTTLTVTATRDWTVTLDEATAEWLVVDPAAGTASADPQTVTVSALANDGYSREASVAFTIDMQTRYLTVKQDGAKGSADVLTLYENDFDLEVAQKTYGSGTSWPYLDQFEGWKNHKGSGAANVTYSFKGMSARANSTSNSNYSDYPGSGNNNMFFGASAYFAVNGIALGEATSLLLSFGTEKYSQDNGSVFKNSEFHIWLSADGAKWVELTEYAFAGGETEGRWNVAAANFSVPAGTANLSICMAVDVASSYRMDDLKLVVSTLPGPTVDFSAAVEKDFAAGNTGGNTSGSNNGGTEVTPPADAIFFEALTSSVGTFTIDNKVVPSGLSAVWEFTSDYSCMKATGYVNATKENLAAEGWLISPEIDLTSYTSVFFTFEHAGGYFGTAENEATVWISKNGGEWVNLPIEASAYPTSWDFKSAGVWDLAAYAGSKIKIAFKYLSTTTKAGTWELRNVSLTATAPKADEDTTDNIGSGDYNAEITFNKVGYENAQSVDGVAIAIDDNITATFSKASANNAPAYYTSGEAVRMYQNGSTLDIKAANGKLIKEIRFTFASNMYYVTADKGTLTEEGAVRVWSGSENSIKFTASGSDKEHRAYVSKIEVAYE